MVATEVSSGGIKAFSWMDHTQEKFDYFLAFVFVFDIRLDDGLARKNKPLVLA